MKRFVMLAALFVAACQPMPAEGGKTDLAQAAPTAAQTPADDASACAARGGKMLPQGRMQTLQCVVSYSDGGNRCTDGDQCEGSCRIPDVADAPLEGAAAVGQCQPTSSRFGCYTTVEDGKAAATICID
jgi:putative hemolysin